MKKTKNLLGNYPDDNMWSFPDEHPKDDDKPFVYTSPPLTSEPYNIITEFQNNTETTVVKDKEETKKYNSVTEPAITNPVNENNVNNETDKKSADVKNKRRAAKAALLLFGHKAILAR